MEIKSNDLVYVDLRAKGEPPICAISKYMGSTTLNSSEGYEVIFDIIETQHHGIVYVDSDASEIKKFKI